MSYTLYPAFKYFVPNTITTGKTTIVVPFDLPVYTLNCTPETVHTTDVGVFSIPMSGIYLVNFTLEGSQAVSKWILAELQVNGVGMLRSSDAVNFQANTNTVNGVIVLPLLRDDKVRVVVNSDDTWIYGLASSIATTGPAATKASSPSTFIQFTYLRPGAVSLSPAAASIPAPRQSVNGNNGTASCQYYCRNNVNGELPRGWNGADCVGAGCTTISGVPGACLCEQTGRGWNNQPQ